MGIIVSSLAAQIAWRRRWILVRGMNHLKVETWNPIWACYAVMCDTEDTTALWENIEVFNAAPYLCWIERKCFELEGHEPFGVIFFHVPRWKQEEFKAATENYMRRQEWMTPGFKELAEEIYEELNEI